MCHEGCRYEDEEGNCIADWGEGIAPPDGECFPAEETGSIDFLVLRKEKTNEFY